ncbi:6791_t:CDS:2, partial [Dentiscutata heterogama]
NTVVPDPYMDEIFHIPQAQRYCEGNYHEWDPKLTTPPGLAFNAFVLSSFPVNWFYTFLYYTDSGSTFFVLWAYLLALKRQFWMSAMVSGVGVLFRQTNIGWVCFTLGVSIVDVLSDDNFSNKHFHGILRPVKEKNIGYVIGIQEIFNFALIALRNLVELIIIFYPYLLVLLSFIYFIIWNGGIVL